MSHSTARALAQAATDAVNAKQAELNDGKYAVVVIVRQIPFAGMPLVVAGNITTGNRHVLNVITEAAEALRKDATIL